MNNFKKENRKPGFVFLLLLLVLTVQTSLAQGPKMERVVARDTAEGTKGPNLKKYKHWFVNLGFAVPHSNNHYVKYGLSHEIGFGYRTKRKLGEHYALGMDLAYQYRNYNVKNLVGFPGVDSLNVTKERYVQRGFQFDLYQRINYGKRGNFLGKYIDLVVWGELPFWNFHSYRFSTPESQKMFGKNGKITLRNFDWDERFLYGVQLRIGFNKNIFYGNYRLSQLFTTASGLPQLSPIVVGFQRGF
jgi:hypothetical protein